MGRPRQYRDLKRGHKARRQAFDRVLIVSEGKTEKIYLDELAHALRLSIPVIACGAGPSAVWKRAKDEFERDHEYDRIVCVFDRDTHHDYAPVLAEIQQHIERGLIGERRAGKTRLMPITSDPCFEYWLLLHFAQTTAAFTGPADVLARLRRCEGMAGYGKTTAGLFQRLRPRLDTAIANAHQARQAATDSGSEGPMTRFDELVEYLQEQGARRVPRP